MAKVIVINEELCLGCKQCVTDCALAHSEVKSLVEAMAKGVELQSRVHIEKVGEQCIPLQCRNCEDAPCITTCPKEAISRSGENEPVKLDADRCTGCTFCLSVCPFGVIEMSRDGKAAVKCDLCAERTEAGQLPACVEACPTGAIQFVELDESLRLRLRESAEQIKASLPADEPSPADEPNSKMARCNCCDRPFAPVKQLQFIRSKLPEHVPLANLCCRCRRSHSAALLARRFQHSEKK